MDTIEKRITHIINTKCGGNRSRFARALNVTPAYAAQLYAGDRLPSDRTIADICREFRINEKWLRTGEGEMEIADTQRDKLQNFFADVLATAPDERSAFVAALDDLPPEFWPLVAELARKYVDNLKKE